RIPGTSGGPTPYVASATLAGRRHSNRLTAPQPGGCLRWQHDLFLSRGDCWIRGGDDAGAGTDSHRFGAVVRHHEHVAVLERHDIRALFHQLFFPHELPAAEAELPADP